MCIDNNLDRKLFFCFRDASHCHDYRLFVFVADWYHKRTEPDLAKIWKVLQNVFGISQCLIIRTALPVSGFKIFIELYGQDVSLVVFWISSSRRILSTAQMLRAYMYLALATLFTAASDIKRVAVSRLVVAFAEFLSNTIY